MLRGRGGYCRTDVLSVVGNPSTERLAPQRRIVEAAADQFAAPSLAAQQQRCFRYPTTASYSTNFNTNEAVLSEGGIWLTGLAVGLDWTDPTVSGGFCFGTQPSNSLLFNDSVAIVDPARIAFPPNQYAAAVLHRSANSLSGSKEVELILRGTLAAHVMKGYEVNLNFDGGYCQVIHLGGTTGAIGTTGGDFPTQNFGSVGFTPADGDLFEAQIVGNIVSVWITHASVRNLIGTTDITTGPFAGTGTVWTTGQPGFGSYLANGAADWCHDSWTATGL